MGKSGVEKDFDSLTEEVIENIRNDRKQTTELLKDLMIYVSGNGERHKEVSLALAKYVETLQRSNEQLVKVTGLVQKTSKEDAEFSDGDIDDIFDELNENSDKQKVVPEEE